MGTPIGRSLRQAVGASHRAGARERPSGPARLALQQTPVLEPSMMFPAGFFRFWEPSRRFLNRLFLFQFLFRFSFFYFSSFTFFFFSVSFFQFLFSFPFFLFKFIFKKNPNFNFFSSFSDFVQKFKKCSHFTKFVHKFKKCSCFQIFVLNFQKMFLFFQKLFELLFFHFLRNLKIMTWISKNACFQKLFTNFKKCSYFSNFCSCIKKCSHFKFVWDFQNCSPFYNLF